jgi:hypothetical protein
VPRLRFINNRGMDSGANIERRAEAFTQLARSG